VAGGVAAHGWPLLVWRRAASAAVGDSTANVHAGTVVHFNVRVRGSGIFHGNVDKSKGNRIFHYDGE
jgi:hypothetical protein